MKQKPASGCANEYLFIRHQRLGFCLFFFRLNGGVMTIEYIKQMDREILTPKDVAPVLGCDPNMIRRQAKEDIKQLGFPASKVGTRIKIPRKAFIAWYEGKG